MLSTAYQAHVLDVLTEAFQDDPVVGWLFPDPAERRRLQPLYFTGLLRHPGVETDQAGGGSGVAVWLALPAGRVPFDQPHPGPNPDSNSDSNSDSDPGPDPLAAFGTRNAERLVTLGRLLADRHPHQAAHRYLACMGVRPEQRGAGLGSALLRQGLDRADAEHVPAYLEASSARSRELYLRHGFEDLGEPVHLPGNGPAVWPMWRPQPTTSNAH